LFLYPQSWQSKASESKHEPFGNLYKQKNTNPPYPLKGGTDAFKIPDDLLDSQQEIKDWLEYKKQKGQSYKPKGLEALWRAFRAIPKEKRRESVDHSMANNWTGLFEKRSHENGQSKAGYATAIPGKYPG